MGHLGHLRDEYEELVERLGDNPVGLPMPENPAARAGWIELLEILFTPEEARIAAKLPLRPSTTKVVAKRLGMTAERAQPLLESLADKGIVFDLVSRRTGSTRWVLTPNAVTMLSFPLKNLEGQDPIPKERFAKAAGAYLNNDEAYAREAYGAGSPVLRALAPEELVVENELPEVADWERVTELIAESKKLAVSQCSCRHRAEHLGTRCEAELEVCLSLNGGARIIIDKRYGREIDQAEAFDIVARSRDQKLVQLVDNVRKKPILLCNCCSCCCDALRFTNQIGLPGVNPSGFIGSRDPDKCKGCALCEKACPVGAITMRQRPLDGNGGRRKWKARPEIDANRCIGCGVCAWSCEQRAVSMVRREKASYVPTDRLELALRTSIERGRFQFLVERIGSSHGAWFLSRVLSVLCSLPASQKLLASEQVQSRFIRFLLKR